MTNALEDMIFTSLTVRCIGYSICAQRAVPYFVDSSVQHRENEAEPDSNETKNQVSKTRFKPGSNVKLARHYIQCSGKFSNGIYFRTISYTASFVLKLIPY